MTKAILLIILLGSASLASGQVREPEEPNQMSASIRAMVTGRLPPYNPAVHREPPREALTPEPGVILMPRMEVRERKAPQIDPDSLLSREALRAKARAAYRDELLDQSGLNYLLNVLSIPLIGPSFSLRAEENYRANKMRENVSSLDSVIKAVGRTDPAGAAKLQQELTNMVAGRHPSGN